MSTQIRFRLSGEEEQAFLEAARQAGLAPDAYARVRALAPVSPAQALVDLMEGRLAALEAKPATQGNAVTPAATAQINGIEATDLLLAVRDEVRRGLNAFLVILDAEPLPAIPLRRASPDKTN